MNNKIKIKLNMNGEQSEEKGEWSNVIQLLPCKKQGSTTSKPNCKKRTQKNDNINKNIPKPFGLNNTLDHEHKTQELLEIKERYQQKTTLHSKISLFDNHLNISDDGIPIEIIPSTTGMRHNCQCECLIV